MIRGNLLDVFTGDIYPAEVEFQHGTITCVKPLKAEFNHFILPGFIDAHIHIESSMLSPSRFAEAVVPHGTSAVVADPHEIANVMGMEGINYMVEDSNSVPLKVYFTAPSCVPATTFETSGATIGPDEIEELLVREEVVALGEMMNFPGVIGDDATVKSKIQAAQKYKKPVDGHAPLLTGSDLCKYISAGISTDHECTNLEEALEKKRLGMKIMIREGSSARNLEELWKVGGEFLVSDDRHAEDLLQGHLDHILRRAVSLGMDPLEAVRMVTINPAQHYGLKGGAVAPGRAADLVVIDNLEEFTVNKVFIQGELVAQEGRALFKTEPIKLETSFKLRPKIPADFDLSSKKDAVVVRVIQVVEGQLLTLETEANLTTTDGILQPNLEEDILKIAVVERYGHERVANAFVKGFKLKKGAIASSVAHDSHNIIVVGTDSTKMAEAVNTLLELGGGLVALSDDSRRVLRLPLAGLMSTKGAETVSNDLEELKQFVRDMGCALDSPFMTMSFLALLVIPQLKISDQGLFDVDAFQFVDVAK
ncbi:MAG: adenine deaminase [Methanobacteriaceae archaeon]|nr:adenine deaminase [Methanobacteriaceae archaeon]